MKKSVFSFGIILLFSAILWSCSDSSDNNLEEDLTLVQLMEVKANALSDAVLDISESEGFKIITVDDSETLKSSNDSKIEMSITLDDIKGIYDYVHAVNDEQSSIKSNSHKWFNKVGDSENFILQLPKEIAMHPSKLYENEDAEYKNDFVITTSDYNYSYSGVGFNYVLDSKIDVDTEYVGELYIAWSILLDMPIDYKSEFVFANGYSVSAEFGIGKTASYEFSLKKGDEIIYKEEVDLTSSEDDEGELEYAITLGNIKIVLNSELETYRVYRNGELEEGTLIQIVQLDQNSDEGDYGFCRKAIDVKITFANGDIIQLSDFISDDTLDLMDEIFTSMYDIKFVKHIVDKVALEVYNTNSSVDSED
ncbi:hypothetical protein EMN46_01390 [Ancylomarina sp. 16SWW S1-10-2]|nr:hypothetical protein [Ancylomarina sp. 16SWW S1-10-2]